MPPSWDRLRHAVTDLEQQLQEISSLDDDSRELLEEASREIQNALHKNDQELLKPTQPLTQRLSGIATGFEVSHPTLAGVLQKMIDALGQLGI